MAQRSPEARQRNLTALQRRANIAKDTIAVSPRITAEHSAQGATLDSTFISEQLPALDPAKCPIPEHVPVSVDVVNSDSFALARKLMKEYEDAKGSTTVLNLASDVRPAGGWTTSLSKTQEEYYPWPNLGPGSVAGVYSPGVVIFRDDLDHDLVDLPLEERRVVSIITVAAPRAPKLTSDQESFANSSDLEDLRGKIRLVYRIAAHNGQRYLVLGAMGCGAYRCPPKLIAEEMKTMLLDPEFKGWFKKVVFAVYSVPGDGARNFPIFSDVFKDVKV